MLDAIDICGGAGGWACAARGLPIRIRAAVDLWPAACRTYSMNHPGVHVMEGDIRHRQTRREIMGFAHDVDLVLGGIPCEWLSVRRKLGIHNEPDAAEMARERATLKAALGLVEKIRPRYWCLEDVPGLVRELPPEIPWIEIAAAMYSPQRRKRVYVGRFPPPMFAAPVCPKTLADCVRPGPYRIGKRSADREIVTHNAFTGNDTYGARPARKSPTICAFSSRRDAELVIVDDDLPGGRRQIEWQEGARAQGFPDDYVFYGSPGDVWKMIGQAVQIDTARAILQAIVEEATRERQDLSMVGAGQ